jgi:CRISPR-associated protein Csd2
MTDTLKNRYEFVLYFDVENGNPNGDPDAGNMPRIDPQTGFGIVTDVCLKRKVRNYVEYAKDFSGGHDIYVTEGAVLNTKQQEVYEANSLGDGKKAKGDEREKARKFMCERFFDVRTFGAVMDTGDYKCGQVRGPVQLCFARSADSILQQEITITRMAKTTSDEKSAENSDDDAGSYMNRTMGRKYVVPYGLYRAEGFISAKFAQKTGFSEEDLELFWTALVNMFDHDHSAARGKMSARKLFVFKHDSELGNAPAAVLFETITADLTDKSAPPRAFGAYAISVDRAAIPSGVELIEKL